MRIRFTSKSKGDPVPTSKISNSAPDITKDTTSSDGILSKIPRPLLPFNLSILPIKLDEWLGNALRLSKGIAIEEKEHSRLVQSSPIEPKRLACSQDVGRACLKPVNNSNFMVQSARLNQPIR